jgi:hypothetical protein
MYGKSTSYRPQRQLVHPPVHHTAYSKIELISDEPTEGHSIVPLAFQKIEINSKNNYNKKLITRGLRNKETL